MSRGRSLLALTTSRCTAAHCGPIGRASCLNTRGPSMLAAIPDAHHPRISACRKNERKALELVATETRPQSLLPLLAKNSSTSLTDASPKEQFFLVRPLRNFSTCQQRLR